MRGNYGRALAFVRVWEKGLVDHPEDPGGITKDGISLRFLRSIGVDFNGDGVIDGRDVRELDEATIDNIYREHFWDKCLCDYLPGGLDLAVFDSAVNQGPKAAARFLQKAVGAQVDGAIGPETLAAAGHATMTPEAAKRTLREFCTRRALHYSSLAIFAVFGLGWLRRLFDSALTARDMQAARPRKIFPDYLSDERN